MPRIRQLPSVTSDRAPGDLADFNDLNFGAAIAPKIAAERAARHGNSGIAQEADFL
jgi:hypothetical protein